MKKQNGNEEICCPKFEPQLWDEKIFDWEEKKFIKDRVCSLFYMPLNFGAVMKRLDKKVRDAQGQIIDGLCLTEHTSKWNMNVYLAVDKNIPAAEPFFISGKFFCKVYEGPFQNTGKWCNDFEKIMKDRNLNLEKMYMWYTTCPKCAKKYGKNYVAIFGKIS